MNRIAQRWLAVGALALALPVAASAQQAFARNTVNLRAGPAGNYPLIATIGAGQPFEVLGCTSGYSWCDVVMPDGLRGWVYAQSVDYAYEQRRVPIATYGAAIGIPLVTFAIGSYWGNNYRDRSFYDDRRYWGNRPPPRREEGWQRPAPPRAEWRPNPYRPNAGNGFRPDRDRRDDRDGRRDDERMRQQQRVEQQRQQQDQQRQQLERQRQQQQAQQQRQRQQAQPQPGYRPQPQSRPGVQQQRQDPARQVERAQRENVRRGFTPDGRQKE